MVRDGGSDSEIVRHEKHREPAALGLGPDETEDLRLDGDVQRRRRLIRDQDLGIARERRGDEHALAHATAELVGVAPQVVAGIRDADLLEERCGAAPRIASP